MDKFFVVLKKSHMAIPRLRNKLAIALISFIVPAANAAKIDKKVSLSDPTYITFVKDLSDCVSSKRTQVAWINF